ncbi:MAG: hypothetical protein ACT4PT_04220 [Methanobacteriota archaeon]
MTKTVWLVALCLAMIATALPTATAVPGRVPEPACLGVHEVYTTAYEVQPGVWTIDCRDGALINY